MVNFVVTCTHGSEGSWLIVFSANPDKLQMSEFDDAARVMGSRTFHRLGDGCFSGVRGDELGL
ncbi:hypothetical protein OG592_06460 [Streptomyces avidinii]|uniref:hypothetical protein n=1 Tax=Streptomyces avidinii TaxID=1895 RepID=UPI00386B1877|nr:hypothetical protein OG592_06460 [Streptomyces avidinii]